MSLEQYYQSLKSLRIPQMIEERVFLAMYKITAKIHPSKLQNMFEKRENHTTTRMTLRNRQELNVPTQNTRLSSLRFEVKAARLWNEYGNKMYQENPSQPKFKRALREYLLKEQER